MLLNDNLQIDWSEIEAITLNDLLEAIDHGILVSNLAASLSKKLGMDQSYCYSMALAGMVHDIGKLKLGSFLYGKNEDTLIVEEMKYVRMHPIIGEEILKEQDFSGIIVESVYHHHENYDGTGYPSNIKGENIPIGARILRVCDVFAALVSDRRYRKAYDIDTAIELMIEEVKNFDMKVFLAFLEVVHSDEFSGIQDYIYNINEKNYFQGNHNQRLYEI
jgi:putative nucleotidyltransferase with HDIG domain